jgi:hypothetical protein
MTPARRKEIAWVIRWMRRDPEPRPAHRSLRVVLAEMKAEATTSSDAPVEPRRENNTNENSRRALLDYERCREWSRT